MSENIYKEEYVPFTYFLVWKKYQKHYYGVRTATNCHPNDLWKTYFTSSKHVKEFRKTYGEPDLKIVDQIFQTAEEALEYESLFLTTVNAANDSHYLNQHNGGTDFNTVGMVTVIELSTDNIIQVSKENYHNNKNVKYKSIHSGIKQSEEHCKKRSEALKGKKQSEERCRKQSEAMKGIKHSEETCRKKSEWMKGKIWINNGVIEKIISKDCLSEYPDFSIGRLPRKSNKQNVSNIF